MKLNDLKPASTFAQQYGVKSIIYGPPGSAKTPLVNTCPRPLLLAVEPGLLSMRGSNVPTWRANTPALIDEFFLWFFNSNETKGFDTIAIDSVSHMCEIYLADILNGTSKAGNKVHGQAAYGEMARIVMNHLRPLYYTQYKHVYGIAKQEIINQNNVNMARPYYPGRYLPVEIPHLYDEILHLAIQNVPGHGQVRAFRCWQSIDVLARDRTGNLSEFEPPDFGQLVNKAMQ